MSEVIVYEDTPFADYLQSIDSIEQPVKIETSLSPSPKTRKLITINPFRLWKRSFFHDAFSISLPRVEENAFEEKFKYIIVTSPLLRQKLSIHHHNHYPKEEVSITRKKSKNITGPLTAMTSGLVVLLGVEKYWLRPRLPFLTLFFSTSASLFFFYRHKRRSSIRQLFQLILTRLQSLIEKCETFDAKVHRVLITIQEIELVSRGYRLSTPLSPISRIEQSTNKERRKCIHLRNELASTLRRVFILFEEGIIDLIDVRDKKNLGTLYEMYNVDTIASLSAVDKDIEGGYSLEQLKQLNHIMHSKRRECMVNLLALNEDQNSHMLAWKTVNEVLAKLETEVESFTDHIAGALEAEFYTPLNQDIKTNTKLSDARLQKFVHRLASLEQQTRTMEAKLYLCNEGVRELNSEKSPESHERLLREYLSVQKAFEDMLIEWEIGKSILQDYLKPSLPNSPVQSPTHKPEEQTNMEETEGKGLLLDSEDVSDILNLPMPAKASVYEAISGVVEKNSKEKSKMSRQERIEEMKKKRVKETEEKAKRIDSQTMVHELKSVLNKRVTQLDLEKEEEQQQQQQQQREEEKEEEKK